jgi:putative molybdopterin biosynthesis protein
MKNDKPLLIVTKLIDQFKDLRLKHNMSHEDLAQKSGVTRPAISHIEGGKRKPSLLLSIKIAEALGKDLSEMLRQAENDPEKK